jgi:hypothetical protein
MMVCLGLGGRRKHTHTTDKQILQVQTSIRGGGGQHPRHRLHLRRYPNRPRTATRSEDLHLKGRCQHSARAIAARVSSKNLARADGQVGRSVASASCPPRTSARLMASAARLQCWSCQWTIRPGPWPPLLHLLGLGSPLLLGRRSFFSNQLRLCPR